MVNIGKDCLILFKILVGAYQYDNGLDNAV